MIWVQSCSCTKVEHNVIHRGQVLGGRVEEEGAELNIIMTLILPKSFGDAPLVLK